MSKLLLDANLMNEQLKSILNNIDKIKEEKIVLNDISSTELANIIHKQNLNMLLEDLLFKYDLINNYRLSIVYNNNDKLKTNDRIKYTNDVDNIKRRENILLNTNILDLVNNHKIDKLFKYDFKLIKSLNDNEKKVVKIKLQYIRMELVSIIISRLKLSHKYFWGTIDRDHATRIMCLSLIVDRIECIIDSL